MSKRFVLKWQPLEYKATYEKKKRPLFRLEIGIFDIFFRRLQKESFENLQINSN